MDRYLPAHKVKLPATMKFAPDGHCEWCNQELTGKAKKFCIVDPSRDDPYWDCYSFSDCAIAYWNWWYSMPAYKRAVLIRDNFTCLICGYHEMQEERPWLPKTSNLACDHIIPRKRDGPTVLENLQTLCERCNRMKGTKVLPFPIEFRALQALTPSRKFRVPLEQLPLL